MQVSTTILLARARRKGEALACVQVTNFEVAEAVVEAVEQSKRSVILSVEVGQDMGLLGMAQALVMQASTPIALHVDVHSLENVRHLLVFKPSSISLCNLENLSRTALVEKTKDLVREVSTQGVEVAGNFSHYANLNRLVQYVQETGVHYLSLPLGIVQDGTTHISPSFIKEVCQAVRVPVIGQDIAMTASMRALCTKAGVYAYRYDGKAINEAFTAGVRTALRNRSQSDPAYYLALGRKAAIHSMISYLS
jgi:fructose/tagatose bisphosphate aldolase